MTSTAAGPDPGTNVVAGRTRTESGRVRPTATSKKRGTRTLLRRWSGWLYVLPALGVYAWLVIQPFALSVQYSFYQWNGIGPSTWVGLDNYIEVFSNPDRLGAIANAFKLMFFYTVLAVSLALLAAAVTRGMSSRWGRASQTVLFLPQVIPLVGAGIAWEWLYQPQGPINETLRAIGLGVLARPWLADFDTALPAVGFVGTWLLIGLCTMLLSTGMGKIDSTLYDAAKVDGAGPVREFFAVTLPGVRSELTVCVTVTLIAALASFDVVYVMTKGGPGVATMVPGMDVYTIAFAQSRIGAASAMAVVLMVLVLIVVIPVQRLMAEKR